MMTVRLVIAVALCIVASVVVLRTLSGGEGVGAKHVEQPVLVVNGLPRYDEVRLLPKPTERSLPTQVASLRETILSRAIDSGLSPGRAGLLADDASEHFRILVSGDYNAWVAIVDRIGSTPRGVFANNGLPFGSDAERLAFKKSWDNATSGMRFARMDPASTMLRWSRRGGETIEHEPPPQALPTSFDGGFRVVVDRDHRTADLIEIIVPVELSTPDASEKRPLFFAAMTFALPTDTESAMPYTMTLYSVKTIGGTLVLPAF